MSVLMEATVDADFVSALQSCARACSKQNIVEAWKHVLATFSPDGLVLFEAYDGFTLIAYKTKAKPTKVPCNHQVAFSAKMIDWLGKAEDETQIIVRSDSIKFISDKSPASFNLFDAQAMPSFGQPENPLATFTIKAPELGEAVRRTGVIHDDGGANKQGYAFQAVMLEILPEYMKVICFSAARGVVSTLDGEGVLHTETAKYVREIFDAPQMKLAASFFEEGDVKISLTTKLCYMENDTVRAVLRPFEGRQFPYDRLLAEHKADRVVVVPARPLARALARVECVMEGAELSSVTLTCKASGVVKLEGRGPTGFATEELEGAVEKQFGRGDTVSYLNHKHVGAFLRSYRGAEITISHADQMQSGRNFMLFSDADGAYLYLNGYMEKPEDYQQRRAAEAANKAAVAQETEKAKAARVGAAS